MDMNHHLDAHIQPQMKTQGSMGTRVLHWLHKHIFYNIIQKNHEWKCVCNWRFNLVQYGCFESFPFRQNFVIFVRQIT